MSTSKHDRRSVAVLVVMCGLACPCGLALIGLGGGSPGVSAAQARATTPAPVLSVEDYLEIRALVSSYAFALDGGGNNGYAYADLFAPGAEFIRPYTTGRDNLAKLALDQPHGPLYTSHFITNHVIESAPGGATGKQYLLVGDVPETREKPGSIFLAGHYEDEYVKTPQGWRFKRREFIQSRPGNPPAPVTPPK